MTDNTYAELVAQPLAHRVTGSGPCLLLVAGTGYPGATWPTEFVERLEPHFTVVTFDHRGTGASPGGDGWYSTRLFAIDALALLARLKIEQATVLGHSMGGRVAQWMAIDDPDRVSTLVLASTGAGGQVAVPADPAAASRATRTAIDSTGYRNYLESLQRRTFFTPEFLAEHGDVADSLLDAFWNSRPALDEYLKHVAARQQHDTRSVLDRITQPTLVTIGDRDTHAGGTGSHVLQSEHLARTLPNAVIHVLPDVAHGYFWQTPARTAEVITEWILNRTIDGVAPPRLGSVEAESATP